MPGSTNSVADAASRHPVEAGDDEDAQRAEIFCFGAAAGVHMNDDEVTPDNKMEISLIQIASSKTFNCCAIKWEEICDAYKSDPALMLLAATIPQGFPDRLQDLPSSIAPY